MSSKYVLPKTLTEEVLRGTGIHLGLQYLTRDMTSFVLKEKEQDYYVFDIAKTLNAITVAGKFLSSFNPKSVVIYGAQLSHVVGIQKFAEIFGFKGFTRQFVSGSLTNPLLPSYTDADVLLVTDIQNRKPVHSFQTLKYDARAVEEASRVGIPIVGIGNTNATTDFIDLVIPANNKGNKSVATIFYLLTRSILLSQEKLKETDELPYSIIDFETIEKRDDSEDDVEAYKAREEAEEEQL